MSSLGLDANDLVYMRQQATELMPDTAIIRSKAYVPDGAGGGSAVATPVAGGTVPFRVDPYTLRKADQVIAGREGLIIEYIGTTTFDAPLAPDYEVQVVGGQLYQIVGLRSEHSNNVSRKCYLARTG